jgi:hypothetical protein
MAPDTPIDSHQSQRAHQAVGFAVVERSVLYRKPLVNVRLRAKLPLG